MLNASAWRSRELQRERGELRVSPTNVVMYDGENVEDLPFEDKLVMLRELARAIPELELPDTAATPGEKRQMLEDTERGRHPQTREGVVIQDLKVRAKPKKVKFKEDTDVIIKEFFPGKGKYKGESVGGFWYAYEDAPDKIVGKVGTGLSDKLRRDMHKNPQKYIGRVAKVEGTEKYKRGENRGAIQKPVFKEFHIDKDYR